MGTMAGCTQLQPMHVTPQQGGMQPAVYTDQFTQIGALGFAPVVQGKGGVRLSDVRGAGWGGGRGL